MSLPRSASGARSGLSTARASSSRTTSSVPRPAPRLAETASDRTGGTSSLAKASDRGAVRRWSYVSDEDHHRAWDQADRRRRGARRLDRDTHIRARAAETLTATATPWLVSLVYAGMPTGAARYRQLTPTTCIPPGVAAARLVARPRSSHTSRSTCPHTRGRSGCRRSQEATA
jgi:hypothetical protein